MLGTFLRSTHHLNRLIVGASHPLKVLISNNYDGVTDGVIIKVNDNSNRELFLCFNNWSGESNIGGYLSNIKIDTKLNELIHNIMREYNRCIMFENLYRLGRGFSSIASILVIPENLDELYSKFISENKKVLLQLENKYITNIDNNNLCKYLFSLTENANYTAWAIKENKRHGLTLPFLFNIINWANKNTQLIKELKLQNIVAYDGVSSVCKLREEIHRLDIKKRAKAVISTFNTEQKKLLKANFENIPHDLLSRFGRLSLSKRQNFIRKMSTVSSLDEILRQMAFVSNQHFMWSKESLLDFIENNNNFKSKIVFTNDNIVLLEVNDYEDVKYFAKTTNWCISKNKTYWRQYMDNGQRTRQFILFNFNEKEDSELSIVGFTTIDSSSISHAHSFTNKSLVDVSNNSRFESILKSSVKNIYEILHENKVPSSAYLSTKDIFSTWDEKTFWNVINHNTKNSIDFTIYHHVEDKELVLSYNSSEYVDFFSRFLGGRNYINLVQDYYNLKVFMFVDFTKDITDEDKIRYALIYNKKGGIEDPSSVFNSNGFVCDETFNSLLSLYHLPYDTICRPLLKSNMYADTLRHGGYKAISELFEHEDVNKFLMVNGSNSVKDSFKSTFYNAIQCCSVDFFKLIEKYQIKWEKTLPLELITSYADFIIRQGENYRSHSRSNRMYNEKEFLSVANNNPLQHLNIHAQYYIVYTILLSALIDMTKSNKKIFGQLLDFIHHLINSYEDRSNMFLLISRIYAKALNDGIQTQHRENFLNSLIRNMSISEIYDLIVNEITSEKDREYILKNVSLKAELKSKWAKLDEVGVNVAVGS